MAVKSTRSVAAAAASTDAINTAPSAGIAGELLTLPDDVPSELKRKAVVLSNTTEAFKSHIYVERDGEGELTGVVEADGELRGDAEADVTVADVKEPD